MASQMLVLDAVLFLRGTSSYIWQEVSSDNL